MQNSEYSRQNTLLDGFIIRDGYCGNSSGAGIYSNYSMNIKNCFITENHARSGGGLYLDSGNVKITNCTIAGNTAELNGGGIANNIGTLEIKNTIIWGNYIDETPGNLGTPY